MSLYRYFATYHLEDILQWLCHFHLNVVEFDVDVLQNRLDQAKKQSEPETRFKHSWRPYLTDLRGSGHFKFSLPVHI